MNTLKNILVILILLSLLFSSIVSTQASSSEMNFSKILEQSVNLNSTKDQNSTLVVDFLGSPVSGTAPLKVQFEGRSNINSLIYEWDFNSDGKIDSKEKNPVYIFLTPGIYSVSLKVNDGITWSSTAKKNYILVGEKPEANFTASPTKGIAPLTVQFTDTSTGNISSWFWDFGDGTTSTLQNPRQTYTESGQYRVNLRVSNSFGSDIQDIPFFINVSSVSVPILDFISDKNTGNAPLKVQFKALITDPVACEWDFNSDGIVESTEQNPTYEYMYPGVYTVTLKANDGTSWKTVTKPYYITVENNFKVSFTASPTKGMAPLTVQFTDTSTGNISSWFWDFGDGTTSTLQNPRHIYSENGTYTVKLKATNSFDSYFMETFSLINVFSPETKPIIYPPVVDPPVVNPPTVVPPVTKPPIIELPATEPPSVNPPVNLPETTPPVIDRPNVNPPVVDPPKDNSSLVDFRSNLTSGEAPLIVQFEDISKEVLVAWEWDFNSDGSIDSIERNPVCEFREPGLYTVTLKTNNSTEWKNIRKVNYINVTENFQADFNAFPIIGKAPLNVQFTDISIGNPTAWFWDFGDGTISTLQNPNHTYFETGVYSVTLNASNMYQYSVLTWKNYIIVNGNENDGGGKSSDKEEYDSMESVSVGGGGSPEPISNIETKEISQKFIISGNRIKFEFPQKATSIDFIEFDSKKTLGKTTTIIEQLKEKSVLTPIEPGGTIYKHINIWVGNEGTASSENIEDAVIGFRVNKNEIMLNETEISTIKLQRYAQGGWNSLSTNKTWEDDQYIYFQAKTPGFSPFAITHSNTEIFENIILPQNNSTENSLPGIQGKQINKPNETWLIFKDKDWSKISDGAVFIITFMLILFIFVAIREKRK